MAAFLPGAPHTTVDVAWSVTNVRYLWCFLGIILCAKGRGLRFCVVRRCAPHVGVTSGVCSSFWSVPFPVEPADELAVDLAGGVEFFDAPGEFLAGLEQRLFDFG